MPSNKQSPNQTGSAPISFKEWQNLVLVVAMCAALLVMLPMRRKMGLRKLGLGLLLLLTFVLYLVDTLTGVHVSLLRGVQSSGYGILTYYALGFLALGLWERRQRWAELKRGEFWHTYSHGISWFEFLPLRADRIYRNVDPAIAFIIALCVRNLGFTALGVVLMISAICFRIVEEHVYQSQLENDLNACDGILEANMQVQVMGHVDRQQPVQAQSMRDTSGIATGADSGLSEQIANRRREAAHSSPTTAKDMGVYQ